MTERVLDPTDPATTGLRNAVLRAPLGLVYTDADRAAEVGQRAYGLFEGETAVACALVRDHPDGTSQVRQVAVLPDRQGEGLGAAIMALVERENPGRPLWLNARATVVPFYECLGWTVEGEPFQEIGLEHRRMRKPLDASIK